MIFNLPNTNTWKSHVRNRADMAKDIDLLYKNDVLNLNDSILFALDRLDIPSLNKTRPDFSLREIKSESAPINKGWVKREDMFDEVSEWIVNNYSHQKRINLFCEAGYSKIGDKSLEGLPYINHCGKPVLHLNIFGSTIESVSQILRWGRSFRLLGIIGDISALQEKDKGDKLFFLCDAFNNDSIIINSVKKHK